MSRVSLHGSLLKFSLMPVLSRAAMSQLAIDQGWPPSTWVFDGRKNLYTTSPIIGHDEMLQAMV